MAGAVGGGGGGRKKGEGRRMGGPGAGVMERCLIDT